MSFHTIAWGASITQDVLTDIAPTVDNIITIQNSHFLPQEDWSLLFAGAGAVDFVRAQLQSPTFRQFTNPFIYPGISDIAPTGNYQVQDYTRVPLIARANEELELHMEQTSVGAARVFAVVGMSRNIRPAPSGVVYTMRGVATTTVTANAWSTLTVTWQSTLPEGLYSVIGLGVSGATVQAGRLIFEDQVDRPGVVGNILNEIEGPPLFWQGGLGEFGRFRGRRMPDVEFLCNAADTAQVIAMQIVRIG